jgi:hypothetical protein
LLASEQSTRRDGRIVYAFSHEALTRFCKQSRELLLKRRWPERRLEFVREYIFAPKYADFSTAGSASEREKRKRNRREPRSRRPLTGLRQRLVALLPQAAARTTARHLMIARDSRKAAGHA